MDRCICRRAFGNDHKDDCPESEIYQLRAEVERWRAIAGPYTPEHIGSVLDNLDCDVCGVDLVDYSGGKEHQCEECAEKGVFLSEALYNELALFASEAAGIAGDSFHEDWHSDWEKLNAKLPEWSVDEESER
ncbi:MAG: hypothetical protein V3U60_16170 [Gammaproteobacteria bacterium]